jgi:hypothetical protein
MTSISVRAELVEVGTDALLFQSDSSNSFSILTLRQASFDRLRTEQGERIEKQASDTFPSTASRRGMNGLEKKFPKTQRN